MPCVGCIFIHDSWQHKGSKFWYLGFFYWGRGGISKFCFSVGRVVFLIWSLLEGGVYWGFENILEKGICHVI